MQFLALIIQITRKALMYNPISSEFFDQLNAGMILCGGGALLAGLAERIETEIGISVKMSKINFSSRKMHNAAKFLSSVGLAHAGFDKNFGRLLKGNQYSHLVKGVVERVKELYEEYF